MKPIWTKPPIKKAILRRALLTIFSIAAFATALPRARADAVDDLRQALPLRLLEQVKLSPAFLENRREILEAKVKNLKTIGELRRALALEEWKDNPGGQVINEELRAIDADMRKLVAQRLTKAIQIEAEKGDAASRMALANMIAEIGPTVRSAEDKDKKGYARSLTKEVIQLAQDKNYAVRQQALRALGNIFPDPKEASAVFQAALEKENPDLKLLAAKGLGQLIRNVDFLQKQKGTSASVIEADHGDVLEAVLAVLGANSAGLKSSDPRVRAQSLRNIQAGADAMHGIIKNPFLVGVFPSESRRLTPDEKASILKAHDDITFEIKSYLPIINALRAQEPMLARSLEDADGQVRLAALEALEDIAIARIRLKKRVQSVPVVVDEKMKDDRGNRELLKANDPLELFVGKNLSAILNLLRDPDPKARRMAVAFLELIEEAATPALPLLITSLTDEDRYVRRTAARTIANIAPDKAAMAVPGLANLLSDSDLGVRRAAAKTLAEVGPLAQAAVPALAKAVVNGDAVARIDAMEALRSIGPDAGKAAVPQLIEALRYPDDPRVKSQAAKVLGSFKGAAAAAIPELQHALGDVSQEVRDSASQAILEINQGNQEF
jgi:HEAT repeat protein